VEDDEGCFVGGWRGDGGGIMGCGVWAWDWDEVGIADLLSRGR